MLLQGPVRGVRARLAELLAEWPDHPLLTQLAAIADRLLGVAAYWGITFATSTSCSSSRHQHELQTTLCIPGLLTFACR